MTYYGAQMVVENYNIMGVAKRRWKVPCVMWRRNWGQGHPRTCNLAWPACHPRGSGIAEFDLLLDKARSTSPARKLVTIDEVGATCAFLTLMPRGR